MRQFDQGESSVVIHPDDPNWQVMPTPLRRDEPLFDAEVDLANKIVLDSGALLGLAKSRTTSQMTCAMAPTPR
jgi:hypothetical protein